MDVVDCVVVGAGVVGLAVARALARDGRETLIVEKEGLFGSETSARNSEVIHAGIYYPQGSLKARFCVAGRDLLYDYCQSRHIAHRRCGKLIVATNPKETEKLQSIKAHAEANGVLDMQLLDGRGGMRTGTGARAATPRCCHRRPASSTATPTCCRCCGEAEEAGAAIRVSHPADPRQGDRPESSRSRPASEAPMTLQCSGSSSTPRGSRRPMWPATVDGNAAGSLDSAAPTYAKGNYFSCNARPRRSRTVIYPVPEPGGLGVHHDAGHRRAGSFRP
jgi:hypothetical protein